MTIGTLGDGLGAGGAGGGALEWLVMFCTVCTIVFTTNVPMIAPARVVSVPAAAAVVAVTVVAAVTSPTEDVMPNDVAFDGAPNSENG